MALNRPRPTRRPLRPQTPRERPPLEFVRDDSAELPAFSPEVARTLSLLSTIVVVVSLACVGVVLAIALWRLPRVEMTLAKLMLYYLGPLAVGTGLVAVLRAPLPRKLGVALALVTTLTTLVASEVFLEFRRPPTILEQTIRRIGGPYDDRPIPAVVDSLRRGGARAFPLITGTVIREQAQRGVPFRPTDNGQPFLPLAGVSNATTVMCNENGQYVIYRSDEHGYNNPSGTWSRRPLDIAVIGDSFALGVCVAANEGIVARIRQHFPSTLNLANSGNGPILDLANLREWLPQRRPKVVLWVYYENDIDDLEYEKRHPLVARYLDPAFGQNLEARQAVVDREMARFVDDVYANKGWLAVSRGHLRRIVRLRNLKDLFRVPVLIPFTTGPGPDKCCDLALFGTVLRQARDVVDSWGGEMFFVFLPSGERFSDPRAMSPAHARSREQITATARSLGLPVIDVYDELAKLPDPKLAWYLPGAHYNALGYAVAADAILRELARRGLAPAALEAAELTQRSAPAP